MSPNQLTGTVILAAGFVLMTAGLVVLAAVDPLVGGVLFLVGVYPHTPDQLIEVVIEDDRVWIHYADWFARPLRLTPPEALATASCRAGSRAPSMPYTSAYAARVSR